MGLRKQFKSNCVFLTLACAAGFNNNNNNNNIPCDTRIVLGIKDEEDTQMLQKDLHKLCKWAGANNMKFNANKFELLRYGKEKETKSGTTYKSLNDSNIDDKEQVRDLGIMMSNTATFTLHIRNIVKKARDKMC